MADQVMRMGARGDDGKAKAIRSDEKGNLGTQLNSRNELVTYATASVPAKGAKSVISRFSELKNYSAVVVAVSLPQSANVRVGGNWYIQKPGETSGIQVSQDTIMDNATTQRFSSGYLEIRGTQLTVIITNNHEADIEATVYIMGIR